MKNRGFTLVELAIVMMIIGLLIAGVLKGQEMVQNARVTNTIKQINGYQAAFVGFQDKYSALPGDMVNSRQQDTGQNANGHYVILRNPIIGDPHPAVGEAALSPEDQKYMKFADEFESRYISQGYYENRTIEDTLDLGWELLSMFEDTELKRIDVELIEKYMPKFRK